ncbi:hypothetical protein AO946_23515 [Pseudomonas aeruginosa]|uniref:hypothetical protein n=1 Tax=Pseudomonas aeruginosa TaxID=287 RepID=UPI00071C1DB0|nr:hypothetical protein [Pseudomonas aeruginosa]KSG23134.1 hypothetical protein AO946_23515 [Pseudomonas aeruginosa]
MQKQTPQWLTLFITAFGAQGLIALAWWLGSLHATRIRAARGSYPILNITGEPAAGKSGLIGVLWWLMGESDGKSISLTRMTRAALHRTLFTPIDWPVVLDECWDGMSEDSAEQFDWDSLKACYSGTTMARLTSTDKVTQEARFQGALVIMGGPVSGAALSKRTVKVELSRSSHSEETRAAIIALSQLTLAELGQFKTAAKRHRAQVLNLMHRMESKYVDCLLEDTEHNLMQHDANNLAQLRVLIDALAGLYAIPPEQTQQAHALVHQMAWNCCSPH